MIRIILNGHLFDTFKKSKIYKEYLFKGNHLQNCSYFLKHTELERKFYLRNSKVKSLE